MSFQKSVSRFLALGLMAVLLLAQALPAASQLALPTGVTFVEAPDRLRAGGSEYTLVVQLLTNDAFYPRPGTGVYIISSDSSLVDIAVGTFVVTDEQGRAYYTITTGQGQGNVSITAVLLNLNGNMRASRTFQVMGLGNVSGAVTDAAGVAVPGATVAVYQLSNGTKGQETDIPAVTTDEQGQFTLSDVPYGEYYVEAGIEGQAAGAALTVDEPDEGLPIAIEGYTIATPTPGPTATPEPTAEPSPTATPTATPAPGIGDSTIQAAWIIAAALGLAAVIVAVQLWRERKAKK